MKHLPGAALLLFLLTAAPFAAGQQKDEYIPLFNGKNLDGWVNVNCAPGTFFVKGDEIITTGKPTGYLRTAKQYENFVAEFEWLHVNIKEEGNSGFFVWADALPAVGTPYTRGIEVQVLVNLEKKDYYTSQGDLFSIHGATCKPDRPHPHGWMRCLPSENRCKGGGEWNHYKVIGKDGTLKLHVNGKEVSGLSECKPRKGYLALESEGAECHFRNLKIKELPSSSPKPEETATVAEGFQNLYTGLDLSGWKADEETMKHWQPRDWVLLYDGKGKGMNRVLRTENEFGDGEWIVDFRFPKKEGKPAACVFALREGKEPAVRVTVSTDGTITLPGPKGGQSRPCKDLKSAGQWNRLRVALKGTSLTVTVNHKRFAETTVAGAPERGAFALRPESEMEFGNLFVLSAAK
jgi:hypothetical protein